MVGCLDQLVDRYVADSRFDPLRVAETEQQLYDQVRSWLGDPLRGALAVEISHQGSTRAVRIEPEELLTRAHSRYTELERPLPQGAAVVLGPTAATLPGLADYLRSRGHQTLTGDEHGLALAPAACPELFAAVDDGAQFLNAISYAATPAEPAAVQTPVATHYVDGDHVARPLEVLGSGLEALDVGFGWPQPAEAVRVNDTAATPNRALLPGDRFDANGTTALCIRLSDGP